jgi:hypothetical protein
MNAKSTSLAAALLFAGAALCLRQGTLAQESWSKLPAGFNQNLPARLGPSSLLGALGGMRRPAADWSYIDALQYIGDNRNSGDGFSQAYGLYREVLWLDPYFHFAVLEGCSFLTWFVYRLKEGRQLMEEAMRVDEKFSRYRLYYAAMAYSEKRADHLGMLAFLRAEVEKPDAPEMLLRSVGNLITKYGSKPEARAYWSRLLSRAHEPETFRRAQLELARLGAGGN